MTEAPLSPIRDAVGKALRFARENWRFVLALAAIGAVATAALALFATGGVAFTFLASIAESGVRSFVYALLIAAALAGVSAARADWLANGARVWGAMIVIGFFMTIVIFVVSMPVIVVLGAGALRTYLPDLEAAGSDQAAVVAVLTRFAENEPVTMLLILVFYTALWMYLTSRLYLSAPASVDQKRILTFETWNWTNGHALKIIGARLLLIFPALLLASAISELIARVTGTDNLAGGVLLVFGRALVTIAVVVSLEAGLSTALYRALRPAEAPRPNP